MIYSKINICQYPTTVLLVDDDKDILSHLSLLFSSMNLLCFFYSDPQKALTFLNKEYQADPFIQRCITVQKDTDADRRIVDFDFRKIHHEIYNPKRFEEISVAVADYAMPVMNGLDFCRNLEADFIKKMMLTGEAEESLAIEAFNEGIIDKFIKKGIISVPQMLIQGIRELQSKYFLKLSEMTLTKTGEMPSCINDANFIGLFNYLCETHDVVEYYLLDEHGSFLMLDAQGNPSWLLVRSDADMENIYEFAVYQDASEKILNGLKNRTLVPYFHTDQELKAPLDQCHHCFHPAVELKGKQMYYYAYISRPDTYKLVRENIVSLEQYLNL